MLRLLANRLERFSGDPEALGAIRRGIRDYSKHLSWYYLEHGRRTEAFRTYLRGFRDARDPGLLVRAAAVFLPRAVVSAVRGRADGGPVRLLPR